MAELGQGEAATRARSRRVWGIVCALFLTGMAVGFATTRYKTSGRGLDAAIDPTVALIAAAVTAVALLWGSYAFFRRVDELERYDNLISTAVGANVLLAVYPVWFLLWKGGWVAEPTHVALYLIVAVGSLIAYIWKKFR